MGKPAEFEELKRGTTSGFYGKKSDVESEVLKGFRCPIGRMKNPKGWSFRITFFYMFSVSTVLRKGSSKQPETNSWNLEITCYEKEEKPSTESGSIFLDLFFR